MFPPINLNRYQHENKYPKYHQNILCLKPQDSYINHLKKLKEYLCKDQQSDTPRHKTRTTSSIAIFSIDADVPVDNHSRSIRQHNHKQNIDLEHKVSNIRKKIKIKSKRLKTEAIKREKTQSNHLPYPHFTFSQDEQPRIKLSQIAIERNTQLKQTKANISLKFRVNKLY